MEKWTKHCRKCHKFIPDDYMLCDFHLREKYGLLREAVTDDHWFDRLYPEDAVLAALRAAERHHDH